jgi:glutamine---fructose-6-phosphate transaminase (isomerizing)
MNINKTLLPDNLFEKEQPVENQGKYTREEILSQPEVWQSAIDTLKQQATVIRDFWRMKKEQQVIFTGCGSTYYLSKAAASLFQQVTGVAACGVPASELWLSPTANYLRDKETILIAISRSGETSETLRACEQFRNDRRGSIITLVCKTGSPLAAMGDINLLFPFAMEQSVAQTRAFSTLYLASVGLCAIWAEMADLFDQISMLPKIGRQIIDDYLPLAADYGKNLNLDRIYFLGSGGRLGLANELSLKMKEMSLTHSEAFHFLEFRHGPKAMVNRETLVIGMVSEQNENPELAVLSDVKELGGEVISIGEHNTNIIFNSKIKEVYRNVLYLPFGQMLAYERAFAKKLDPDRPTNLDAVVKLAK